MKQKKENLRRTALQVQLLGDADLHREETL